MNHMMERWYSATGQRFSMRAYGGAPDEEELCALQKTAEFLSNSAVRIEIKQNENTFKPMLLGSGKIKGTNCYAAIIKKDGDDARCGYIGEGLILESTALGLGTCWLGVSYKKSSVNRTVQLAKGEKLVCIIAIGKPGESYVGRARKSLSELTELSQQQLVDLPEWQQYALSCARLAPSAVNAQPWRFWVEEGQLGIEKVGNNFGFAAIDQGIAMLHMELGASHASVSGQWHFEGEKAIFTAAL